ncbi:MAG: hypothetical protein ABJE95_08155 [Byssovorax sp.]
MRGRNLPLTALAAALAGAALASVAPGCNNDVVQSTTSSGSTSAGVGGGAGGSASATGSSGTGGEPPHDHVWQDCQSTDQAWIRRAIVAIGGRHAWGQAEINAYEDVLQGVRGASGGDPKKPPPPGKDLEPGKLLVAQALMNEDSFRERWSDFVMDALHTVRIETKSQEACYGVPSPTAIDDGSLAAWVRDHDSSAQNPPIPGFLMGDLLSSALQLDDLSVVYRGHLFAMMSLPIDGANVDFLAMERIRRQDFGAVFDAAYIHRDVVCLSCHNSEFSVTHDDDPLKSRAWPVPGLFELSLFGASNGKHSPDDLLTKGPDDLRAHSMLRVADVVGNGTLPYGWAGQCGTFTVPQTPDPLNIDTYFGSIKSTPANPTKGQLASVWDLEASLHRGVDLLAKHGLTRLADDSLADPDEAFAYLVAENIVEKVWEEIMGSRLTIANYFARTAEQRDVLQALTEHFVARHFSLKTLIFDIVAHPAFNLKAPDEGCGSADYELPNLFDPWTKSDNDPLKRGNSPADGVFAVSARPLVRSLHRAMEWPARLDFPADNQEASFQSAIGYFLKDADPGYRGLDFQGRLTWEATYASCPNLTGNDVISKIVFKAGTLPGTTLADGVIALKDRLVGDPTIEPTVEKPALEALFGVPVSNTALGKLEEKLRALCGVLVSSPQLMLGGIPPKDTRDIPKLTPDDITYKGTCGYLAGYFASASAPYVVTCGATSTTVTKK